MSKHASERSRKRRCKGTGKYVKFDLNLHHDPDLDLGLPIYDFVPWSVLFRLVPFLTTLDVLVLHQKTGKQVTARNPPTPDLDLF